MNAPAETSEVLVDGWFRTGDLATVSADGLITIVGRKRERILRGGYSVFPPEVEAVLLTHPAVAEAAVVGTHHPELGEEVAAFVTLRPGVVAGPEELIAYCRQHLAASSIRGDSPCSTRFRGARPARSSNHGSRHHEVA